MIEVWGVVSSTYIPLYVIELQEPSSLQKMAEKLDSSTQNFNEGSNSEVEFWVDNLLVTPTSCSDILETELNTGYKSKLNVRRQINRRTEVQLQPSLLHPEDVSITDSSPEVSPMITARPDKSPREEFVNDEILKNKKTKHVGGERKLFERTEFNMKLLTKELKGLEAYDIPALSKPQIPPEVPPLDVFFEEPVLPSQSEGLNRERVTDDEKGSCEDDEEDCDFEGSEEECLSSEEVSMDEESEMEDDVDLDADTTYRMMLGNEEENEDGSGSQSIVDKMAKVFKTRRLWIRNSHGPVHLLICESHQPRNLPLPRKGRARAPGDEQEVIVRSNVH
ncbi:unnamed protein product [Cuscuta campestris]|uniref:Uncharacterized protein n=1 Tax=Cuscuta campestris TaxID=132261 RepID=A0A484LAY1_9ASTE|nr:unnamed protein product [Cuscuta campestris]